jgi:hypothetical protein
MPSDVDPQLAGSLATLLGEAAEPMLQRLACIGDEARPACLHQLVSAAEASVWQGRATSSRCEVLQRLFRAVERQLSACRVPRHHIHVVIPVADRPKHLQACLDSLQQAIDAFGYGGPISAIVADDSADPDNLMRHRSIVEAAANGQLETIYFGHEAQWRLLRDLDDSQRAGLRNLLGDPAPGRMGHKGASVMRNIASLLLRRLADERERALFWFVDSDQEFHADAANARPEYTLNHFYHLDRLFRECDIEVLTGKVVGDPPVSPAVMGAGLLDDVLAFVSEAQRWPAQSPCRFHHDMTAPGDAAYHDMSALFGFSPSESVRYRCARSDVHEHADSVLDFATALQGFFDGGHPTRSTGFVSTPIDASVASARTVYTGNYVLSATALRFAIPFAARRLRMAGPTLGRLLQAELGKRFVSANLPMCHRRTHQDSGRAEFRPGVRRAEGRVDLSGEYLRQFQGDLVLFSVEELVGQGYPERFEQDDARAAICATQRMLLVQYAQVRERLLQRLQRLQDRVAAAAVWFASDPRLQEAKRRLDSFVDQIDANYSPGATAVRQLHDPAFTQGLQEAILTGLLDYPRDQAAWRAAIGAMDR